MLTTEKTEKSKQQNNFYKLTDKAIINANRIISNYFRKLKLIKSDEINSIGQINVLFDSLNKKLKIIYLSLGNAVLQKNNKNAILLDELWLETLLLEYNETTKYIYAHEYERKVQRLSEMYISGHISNEDLRKQMFYIALMAKVYMDCITVEATKEAYKQNNIKRVKWNSEVDNKTCKICNNRNGKVYPINGLPPFPHLNCRCWITPEN